MAREKRSRPRGSTVLERIRVCGYEAIENDRRCSANACGAERRKGEKRIVDRSV
jgi:hypothetical protein